MFYRDHRRLPAVREGIRRSHRPLRRRRRRPQPARVVLVAAARPARAVDEMRQVVKILPKRALFRDNLALYANYASDFQTGGAARREPMEEPDAYGTAGPRVRAARTGPAVEAQPTPTQTLGDAGHARRVRCAASGLGDLAIYRRALRGRRADSRAGRGRRHRGEEPRQGRREARRRSRTRSCTRGQKAPAIAAADTALATSKAVKIRFLAARVFVEAGETAKARPLIAASPPSCRPSRRPTRRSSTARSRSKRGDARAGDQAPDRSQHAARHLDRPLRAGPRVSGSRRASAGRLASSIAASSAEARRSRCSWTRSRRSAISRRSITTRAASASR